MAPCRAAGCPEPAPRRSATRLSWCSLLLVGTNVEVKETDGLSEQGIDCCLCRPVQRRLNLREPEGLFQKDLSGKHRPSSSVHFSSFSKGNVSKDCLHTSGVFDTSPHAPDQLVTDKTTITCHATYIRSLVRIRTD